MIRTILTNMRNGKEHHDHQYEAHGDNNGADDNNGGDEDDDDDDDDDDGEPFSLRRTILSVFGNLHSNTIHLLLALLGGLFNFLPLVTLEVSRLEEGTALYDAIVSGPSFFTSAVAVVNMLLPIFCDTLLDSIQVQRKFASEKFENERAEAMNVQEKLMLQVGLFIGPICAFLPRYYGKIGLLVVCALSAQLTLLAGAFWASYSRYNPKFWTPRTSSFGIVLFSVGQVWTTYSLNAKLGYPNDLAVEISSIISQIVYYAAIVLYFAQALVWMYSYFRKSFRQWTKRSKVAVAEENFSTQRLAPTTNNGKNNASSKNTSAPEKKDPTYPILYMLGSLLYTFIALVVQLCLPQYYRMDDSSLLALNALAGGGAFLLILYYLRRLKLESFQRLIALVDAKKSYVRYISHELRTPLNAAFLGLEWLLGDLKGSKDPADMDRYETLSDVSHSCHSAVEILNDLLCFDKIESGILELFKTEVPLIPFLKDGVAMFTVPARQKDVNLILDVTDPVVDIAEIARSVSNKFQSGGPVGASRRSADGSTSGSAKNRARRTRGVRVLGSLLRSLWTTLIGPIRPPSSSAAAGGEAKAAPDEGSAEGLCSSDDAYIDRFKMDQVLRNLISNALKFTPSGGTVTVRAVFVPDEAGRPKVRPSFMARIGMVMISAKASGSARSGTETGIGAGLGLGAGAEAGTEGSRRMSALDNAARAGGGPSSSSHSRPLASEDGVTPAAGGGAAPAAGKLKSGSSKKWFIAIRPMLPQKQWGRVASDNSNISGKYSGRSRGHKDKDKEKGNSFRKRAGSDANNLHRGSVRLRSNKSVRGGGLSRSSSAKSLGDRYRPENMVKGRLRISVTDTGAGISPENQKRLFKEVVQFNPEILQAGGGSGFGLFITHNIVALHGGRISVFSEGEGKGSTFTVEFPMSRPKEKRPSYTNKIFFTDPAATASRAYTPVPAPALSPSGPRALTMVEPFAPTLSPTLSLTLSPTLTQPSAPPVRAPRTARDIGSDATADAAAVAEDTKEAGAESRFCNNLRKDGPGSGQRVAGVESDRRDATSSPFTEPLEGSIEGTGAAGGGGSGSDGGSGGGGCESGDGCGSGGGGADGERWANAKSQTEASVETGKAPSKAGSKREGKLSFFVLVVDDSLMNRKMLCKVLKSKGHECEQAEDGEIAVQMVRDRLASNNAVGSAGSRPLYDAILMDFVMPNMDGPTATRRIRDLGYSNPIYGVTGNALETDIERFTSSGATKVIPKPFNVAAFEETMRSRLSSQTTSK